MLNKSEFAKQEPAPWKIYFLWAVVIFVFLVMMVGVAPGRGAGWAVDDGLFLINAWNAANGFGLDRMLPQEPVYLFNALLMKVGLQEYLHFRYVYYVLSFLSSMVFFLGIDRRRFNSPVVPVAVCASLLVSFSSILVFSPFFLLGAGCYFFAIDTIQRGRSLLLAVSGALFAVTGFMHAAFAIAMIVLIGIALVIDHSLRRSSLWPSFLLISFFLWGGYVYWLGIDSLLATPAGHDSSASHLLGNIGHILWFYMVAVIAYLLAMVAFWRRGREKFAAAQALLSVLATLFYGAQFYGAQFVSYYSDWLVWTGLGSHTINLLHTAVRQIVHVPGAVYYLMLFAIFRWLGESWFNSNFEQLSGGSTASVPLSGKGWLRSFHGTASKAFASFNSDVLNRKLTIAAGGFILLSAGYAAGSASNFAICMSAYSSPVLGLTIILWDSLDQKSGKRPSRFFVLLSIVWLGIFGLFALTINLPTFEPIFSRGRVVLQDAPLRGILEQPRYANSVTQLREVYRTNGCQEMTMVALEYIPTVYYILQHPAPNSLGVVRPGVYFPEDRIRALLDLQRGWCVIDATTNDTKTEIARNHGIDKRAAIRAWVMDSSDRVATISSPSADISDIHFYVRDARTGQN